jgi:HEAT repeat protein
MPFQLTQEFVDKLLLRQAEEFQAEFDSPNDLLATTILDTPELELLRVGERLMRDADPAARILGVRLIRELRQYEAQAANDLADSLGNERDEDVLAWIVSAFGFVSSDLVTMDLLGLAAHPDPSIRYHTATALANRARGDLPGPSLAALVTLCDDDDAEVRFSAVYELGAWWLVSNDPAIEAVLDRAARDGDPFVLRAARNALAKGQPAGALGETG